MLLRSVKSADDDSTSPAESTSAEDLAQRLVYFRAQSLPHLLALLLHPPRGFPPEGTSLLVVDSVSAPFPSYFPNATEVKARLAQSKAPTDKNSAQQLQWLLNRKWNVAGDLASQLSRLAASHSMAVLLLNQTHTKIRGQPRPTLSPAVAGGAWEAAVHARVVLYRDWPAAESEIMRRSMRTHAFAVRNVRFAEVLKRRGKGLAVRADENIVPFFIEAVRPFSTIVTIGNQSTDSDPRTAYVK